MTINVLIVDDSAVMRAMILKAIHMSDLPLGDIYEAADGRQGLEALNAHRIDLVLLDINMPVMNGLDVTRDLTQTGIPTSIVILSMYSDDSMVKRAFLLGAKGYLLKKSITDDLISAIQAAQRGELYLSPELGSVVDVDEWLRADSDPQLANQVDQLSPREREVCQLVAQGMTNQAIAKNLNISTKTVEKHRSNMMNKLGVQDIASLVREVLRTGIVFLDE